MPAKADRIGDLYIAEKGNVKKDYIIGKAWFRVSPWKKFGFI